MEQYSRREGRWLETQDKVDLAFGGLDIFVPENCAVKTAVSVGAGGVSDKRINRTEKLSGRRSF